MYICVYIYIHIYIYIRIYIYIYICMYVCKQYWGHPSLFSVPLQCSIFSHTIGLWRPKMTYYFEREHHIRAVSTQISPEKIMHCYSVRVGQHGSWMLFQTSLIISFTMNCYWRGIAAYFLTISTTKQTKLKAPSFDLTKVVKATILNDADNFSRTKVLNRLNPACSIKDKIILPQNGQLPPK